MQRLLYSSKFWAIVAGGVALIAMSLGVSNETVQSVSGVALAVLAVVGPVVYAIATGIEDINKDGQITIEELLEQAPDLIQIILDELAKEQTK